MGKVRQRRLEDQAAIVTGGNSGIGRAVSVALAMEGASVVVVGRNSGLIDETLAEIRERAPGSRALGLALDVCIEENVETVVAETLTAFGRIDILVASAGTLRGSGGWPRQLAEMSAEEWDEVLKVNLKGVFLSNRAVLRQMIRQRSGNIVNVSSTSGLKGLAYDSAYCASKFGVIGLSEAVAEEVRPYGVRVQVLLPGAVDTPMWRDGDVIPHLGQALPVERIARAIVYMLALPQDAMLASSGIVPFQTNSMTLGQCRERSGNS